MINCGTFVARRIFSALLSKKCNKTKLNLKMAKTFERNKPHMNIGTLGHVDHGKTTLSAAISKVLSELKEDNDKVRVVGVGQLDNAPEEEARGVTINSATIEVETEKRHYALTDCPGHRDYIKNMISGASSVETAILVVAATDGVSPQTKEHILLAKQIGIPNVVVFINKCDAVEEEIIELVEMEVRELLEKYKYDNANHTCPIVKGSGLKALEGDAEAQKAIIELMNHVDESPEPKRETDKPFRISIEGVYTIKGRGTVVTGKVETGIVKIGNLVHIITGGGKETLSSTVTGIEAFNKSLTEARAGENVGILLRGIEKKDISRGMVICEPNSITPHQKFKAQVLILTPEEGGRSKVFHAKYRPQFFINTADITGDVVSIADPVSKEEKAAAAPGDSVYLEVNLIKKIAMEKGQKFSIREGGVTVGAGFIHEIIE